MLAAPLLSSTDMIYSTFGVSAEQFFYAEGLSTSLIFFHVDCLSIKDVAKSMQCLLYHTHSRIYIQALNINTSWV